MKTAVFCFSLSMDGWYDFHQFGARKIDITVHTEVIPVYTFFNKKLRSSLSTASFLIFLLLSIVMRTIAYRISFVLGA